MYASLGKHIIDEIRSLVVLVWRHWILKLQGKIFTPFQEVIIPQGTQHPHLIREQLRDPRTIILAQCGSRSMR